MSRRFTVSPYKNALPSIPDKQLWYHDLPLTADDPNLVRASSSWIIVATGSLGGLVAIDFADVGKSVEKKKGGEWNALGGKIFALDVSEDEDGQTRVAVGGQGGYKVWTLPSPGTSFEPTLVSSISTASLVQSLAFHPTTPSLLLTTTATTISIWDTSSSSTEPVIELEPFTPKGVWGASWSWDGREVAAVGKDGAVGIWPPRESKTAQTSPVLLNPLKPSSIVSVGSLFLVAGFSKSRERQLLLFSSKDLSAPLSTTRIDFETAPFFAAVDQERKIVYLAGKGESTLRSYEVSDAGVVTPGTAASLPTAFSAIALAPPSVLDVMAAEINRVLVVGRTTELIPVPIKVPKRHYIDFHEDIFPLVRSGEHAQSASEWLAGGDAQPLMISQDPKAKHVREKKLVTSRASAPMTSSTTSPASVAAASPPAATPPPVAVSQLPTATPPASTAPAVDTPSPQAVQSLPPPSSAPSPPTVPDTKSEPAVVASQPTPPPVATSSSPPSATPGPFTPKPAANGAPAPRWSRNFLSGSSPLLPGYDNLECLSSSLPADTLLLQASTKFFFFPISGPGGRIAVHPLAKKGRLPLQADFPNVSNGSDVVDFVVEEGEDGRLITAGEDGVVKVWKIPESGVEGTVSEPELVVHAKGVDKIAKLVPNPAARHVLGILSNDFGDGYLRICNTHTGKVEDAIKLDGGGLYTAAWSAAGSHLAVACKDRKIRVLDPRQPSPSLLVGPAHDSPRSFQLTWLDDQHLASVGFSSGSLRKILLHRLPSSASSPIETISSFALDVSPSVLFPVYDEDTEILLVWGKGERTVSAFDVQPNNPKTPFHRLPTFAGSLIHGFAFLPKTTVDVKKVEVLKALRLTAKTVEEVSFKVPRAKVEYFQDDVFPPTRGPAEVEAEDWLAGKDAVRSRISLQPEGMKPLSEAPKPQVVVKKKNEFGKKELTEAEKRAQSMDAMFEKAKLDDDEEERIKGDEEWSD